MSPLQSFTKKGSPSVKITSQPHVFKNVKVKEENGVLSIISESYSTNKPVIIELSSFKLHQAGVSGTAELRLNHIDSPSFNLDVKDSSSVSAQGKVNNCYITSQGSTDIDLSNLHCKALNIETEGSADVQVYVTKNIRGRLEGAMDLHIAGDPVERMIETIGAVDVMYK